MVNFFPLIFFISGDLCDIPITSPIFKVKDPILPSQSTPNNAGLIVGVVSIILITIVIAIIIYYKYVLLLLLLLLY